MTQTLQSSLTVLQTSLVDHRPEEPGEGAGLAVPLYLLHTLRSTEPVIWPDTSSGVDEDTCQLNAIIEITDTD